MKLLHPLQEIAKFELAHVTAVRFNFIIALSDEHISHCF